MLKIIKKLNETNSKLKKFEILEGIHSNIWKELVYRTYEPTINYYLTENTIDWDYLQDDSQEVDWIGITNLLDKLSSRTITGNEAVRTVTDFLNNSTPASNQIFHLIIKRNLGVGVSIKTFNKVYGKEFITEIPYMRCSKQDKLKNIEYPAVAQTKADGAFYYMIVDNENVTMMSRNGKILPLKTDDFIPADFIRDNKNGNLNIPYVLMGELLVIKEQDNIDSFKFYDRKTGNGLISSLAKSDQVLVNATKAIEDAISPAQTKRLTYQLQGKVEDWKKTEASLHYVVWDVVPLEDWKKGKSEDIYMHIEDTDRWDGVYDIVEMLFYNYKMKISYIDSKIVNNLDEATDFYKEQLAKGEEGIILKNKKHIWKNGTSTECIKFKNESDCDLVCYGIEPGSGEFTNGLGNLLCMTKDSELKAGVGTGLSREQRGLEPINKSNLSEGLQPIKDFDMLQYIGKIITVKYNEVIKSKVDDSDYSLFLPVFIEVREDKDEADSLEKVLKG